MAGEWQQQNGHVHDEIDLSNPIDDKDSIWSNMGTIDDDEVVAAADEDVTGAGSAGNRRKRGRHANRHCKEHILALEAMFQECPHPDETVRLALSKRVGMDPLQVKFWFQNRRNAKKNQNERQQNMALRVENGMLEEENRAIKAAMLKKTCPTCKGPMVHIMPLAPELRRLRMENEQLKTELLRRTAYLHHISGGSAGRSSRILCDLNVDGSDNALAIDPVVPLPPRHDDLMAEDAMGHRASAAGDAEQEAALQRHVIAALDELMMLVKQGEPMWLPTLDGEVLDHQMYRVTALPGLLELPPAGFMANGTRETGMVMCTGLDLIRIFMDENCWLQTFPDIVASVTASNIGDGCICNGAVKLMNADLRVLSPRVSSCKVKFARQCQLIEQNVWTVVDVSLDANGVSELGAWNTGLPGSCRLLPSGCLIQDMNDGHCMVTMIVNAEYDKGFMPLPLHPLLRSGHTFSARRWLTSLQRRCEFLAQRSSPAHGLGTADGAITAEARNNALELARRMTESFYAAISAPRGEAWSKVADWRGSCGVGGESFKLAMHVVTPLDARAMLCATTAVWLPEIPPQRVFDYICDKERRGEWDVLSNGASVQEDACLATATAQFPRGGVSLLYPTGGNRTSNKKLILQQASGEAPCMVVAYAPIDVGSLKKVMLGGNHDSFSLLPSGFAILPDGNGDAEIARIGANPSAVVEAIGQQQKRRGSLVSVLWSGPMPQNLTAQTIDNVGNLVSRSIEMIKAAVHAKRVITV